MAAKTPPPFLLKVEVLIMIVFVLAFSFWAVRKCNATKEQYRQREALGLEEDISTRPVRQDSARRQVAPRDTARKTQERSVSTQRITPLYVIEEGLKLRTKPSLNSEVILEMKLDEEVYFMNEVTSFRDSINLGSRIAFEPWVKVRHSKGKVGWVYGAGVSYYRQK